MTLLNRNELLDALEAERKECRLENETSGFDRAYSVVESMATELDVELVRHGWWEEFSCDYVGRNVGYYCSECGHAETDRKPFCSTCGAKMDNYTA